MSARFTGFQGRPPDLPAPFFAAYALVDSAMRSTTLGEKNISSTSSGVVAPASLSSLTKGPLGLLASNSGDACGMSRRL